MKIKFDTLIQAGLITLAMFSATMAMSVVNQIPGAMATQSQAEDQDSYYDDGNCTQTIEVINGESYPHEECGVKS